MSLYEIFLTDSCLKMFFYDSSYSKEITTLTEEEKASGQSL